MIKKQGSKHVVVAESGRRMGTYKTKEEATIRKIIDLHYPQKLVYQDFIFLIC